MTPVKMAVPVCFFLLLAARGFAQVLVYDQQSALEGAGAEGGGNISSSQPFGQSFIPSFNSIGFVRLYVVENTLNTNGATLYVDLLSNSITGPIIASTSPTSVPDNFVGYPDFFFSIGVPVVPGVTYFLRPMLLSGGAVDVSGSGSYGYTNGRMFVQGNATFQDLWFREGIVVPEPSSVLLGLLGAGLLAGLHWRKHRPKPPHPQPPPA